MSGDRAGLCDVHAYMNVWYVRQNLPDADGMLAEFANLRAWEARMRAIGHDIRGTRHRRGRHATDRHHGRSQ
ncbi:hypothetical protein [Bradyrhizobium sp. Ash2021]|uniref:hypothetical protein n=1 Tax=Bradyrhizobium sp. Ash2021 TaxID=2954771 RepID=UPI002814992A|nr:hypothetical protein [Bradyrhizobium sp. Ash2021]WMT75202.1 hypothetical protein NL528_01840 [Bradyrhizobium sp. Ash2021]